MTERDCDGSEYCQASQHIEGCYHGPPSDYLGHDPNDQMSGEAWGDLTEFGTNDGGDAPEAGEC